MPEQIDTSSTSDGQTSKFPEKRWSLLVGVNSAPESNKPLLDHAENDVLQMAQILQDHCGFEPFREPLLGAMATSGNVMKAIGRFISERKDDEFLLFYFSGHGIACKFGETNDDDDIYLVTSDFSSLDIDVNPGMHLSLKLLRKMLYEQCYAGKVLIILDCCYAGNISGHGPDLDREELVKHLARYLDINVSIASNTKGLRLALAATAYNKAAYVVDGHGPLGRWLIPALSGETNDAIDSKGRITFNSLRDYLQDQMSEYPPSASGGDAGRNCILAYHSKHPNSHFPYGHDPLFRPREGEFEMLETILRTESDAPVRLGLIGMGGVGKSQLARELVLRTRDYFTDGVFWATATVEGQPETAFAIKDNPLIHSLAELAKQTNYLPPGDDPTRPNEELRARYFCHFLALHPHTLLILDNLDDPNLITTKLSDLASADPQCAVLYTSREVFAPSGVRIHRVAPLKKEQDLLYVLLHNIPGKEKVLALEGTDETSTELEAAHSICKRVGGLPLALILLRSQLETNSWLTLAELDQELQKEGVLAVAQDEFTIKTSLRATFELSWRKVNDEHARQMFQLASYFPEAISIPLWLLALVCEIREEYGFNSDLTRMRRLLTSLSLIEDVSKYEIQMHPLLCKFGQEQVKENKDQGQMLLQDAGERVITEFENVQRLEARVKSIGYWNCLSQIRMARIYISVLQGSMEYRLKRVEKRLDHETFFLATSGLWPDKIPGLFYQQMYNRILEEEQLIPSPPPKGLQWLRQLERVGIEDEAVLRIFAGHTEGVNSVAFSPDGSKVLTGSEDTTARIFDTESGKTLHILKGHSIVIDSVAYSSDGSYVLTGSRDNTARLWNAETGECIKIFKGYKDWVNAVAFSPDSSLIVAGSQDGTARLWDRNTGQLRLTFSSYEQPVHILNIWGEPEEPKPGYLPSDPYAITSIAFSPENIYIALGTGFGHIFLWNTINGSYTNIHIDGVFPISSIAYSQDGTRLLASNTDGDIQLWDCANATSLWKIHCSLHGSLNLAFSHDPSGVYFLTGSWDGVVRLWETKEKRLLYAMEKQVGTINSITFSPDDTTILVGLSNATAQHWERTITPSVPTETHYHSNSDENHMDVQSIEPLQAYLFNGNFSPDGSWLIASLPDLSTTWLWNVQNKRRLTVPIRTPGSYTIGGVNIEMGRAFYFHREDVLIVSFADMLQVLDMNSGNILRSIPLKGRHHATFAADFSPDGHYFLSGSSNHNVVIWETSNGKNIKTLRGHTNIIMNIAFSPDGTQFLTGSVDKTARLWRRQGNNYLPIVLSGHGGPVTKVAFSQDGVKAFTGSTDGLLRVWNTATGSLLVTLDGQTASITLIACSPENKYVLTGDMFNQVRIWNIDEQYRLVGIYATRTNLLAAHWKNESQVLLVDNKLVDDFPRIYKLHLED